MLYESELLDFIQTNEISKSDVCLIGGTSLLTKNIRNHQDIDIAITSTTRKYLEEIKKDDYVYKNKGGITLSEHLEIAKTGVFSVVNISDDELITNKKYHMLYEGYKVAKLELMYSKKVYKCATLSLFRRKDLLDIFLINSSKKKIENWDSSLLMYQNTPCKRITASVIVGLAYIYGVLRFAPHTTPPD